MRSEVLLGVVAILVIASLSAGYLAGSGVRQTETQTGRTVTSTTTIARTVTSVATSTAHTGQPIQVADVETANISLREATNMVVDANASRVYLLQDVLGRYSLMVIGASSNAVPAYVDLPLFPQGTSFCTDLAVDDSTGAVYATIFTGVTGGNVAGEIFEVNVSTYAVQGEVPLSLGTFASDFTCLYLSFDSSTHVLWGPVDAPAIGPEAQNGSVIGISVLTGSVVENVSLGFAPLEVAVDPYTGMVYADGCAGATGGYCGSQQLAIINGTSGSLVTTVSLHNAFYSSIAVDPLTDIVYIAGGSQLEAVNGTSGNVIFNVYPQTCGPFSQPFSVAVIPSLDQVVMRPGNQHYLLVYDGKTGALVNMYSFPSEPVFEGYDANAGELYVLMPLSQDLLALRDVQTTGNVNATLIDVGCG
jgi:hypothetical protein